MGKKGMEVAKCDNCEENAACYTVKTDGSDTMLCSPCKEAFCLGQ